MKPVLLQQPPRILFGNGCVSQSSDELRRHGIGRAFVVSGPKSGAAGSAVFRAWHEAGVAVHVCTDVAREPDVALFEQVLAQARAWAPDAVIGFGGGSPLDVAKLVAVQLRSPKSVREIFGIGLVPSRAVFLGCIPTTAGTGSEVSPNAILIDERTRLKKGAVSPYLVPDLAIADPELTVSTPAAVTAATGLDALVHCMEAFANKFAHPAIDLYALEGIRRIGRSIEAAVRNGADLNARADVMLGALYGGFCLGPVNTAAVHALSYPLGGEYRIAHGVANSLLMTHVFRFNLPAAPERYAAIACALGVADCGSPMATAEAGVRRLADLSRHCGVPQRLREFGLHETDLAQLGREAMKVTRLLQNNPRELTAADAERIYRAAF